MLRPISVLLVVLACLNSGSLEAARLPSDAQVTRISNQSLQLGIDPDNGSCRELVEVKTGFNHLAPQGQLPPLWLITARDGDTVKTFTASDSGPPQVHSTPESLRLVWEKAGPASWKSFHVEATVRLDGPTASLSRWEISVKKPSGVLLESIRYPRLGSLAPRKNEYLAVPRSMGLLSKNPRKLLQGPDGRGRRLDWSYPGLSLQCLAYYEDGGPGFYAACDDPQAYAKRFSVWADAEKQMHFETVHLPEQGAADSEHYQLPYAVVLGTYRGNWATAAELYRASSAAQAFAKQGRLHRGVASTWARDTGLWVWNRGRSPNVLPPACQMQKHLSAPVSVLWHWWHQCAYDAGFPEYFPPRDGTAVFQAAMDSARRDGIHTLLYMNQRLWGMNTKSWTEEGAAAYAVKKPDGTILAEVYNRVTKAPCAPMCMGTSFWREKYAAMAETVVGPLKADGVYMDQACMTLPCHDPQHGHPRGLGRYWIAGFDQLVNDIRDRSPTERHVALAGEHCGEAWISSLDLLLALDVSQERYLPAGYPWEVIPFFQAVYHADTITFGNYASLVYPPYEEMWPQEHAPAEQLTLLDRKFSRQFYLEHARTFVWGQQPMLANFLPDQFDQRPEEMDYVTRLVRIRQQTLKYLLHGTFLPPPALDVPQCDVEFARVSIYAPLSSSTKPHPVVLASAWRSPDGDVALALASIVDEPVRFSLPVALDAYGVRERTCVYRIDETGRHRHGTLALDRPALSIELPPRSLCLLEFCRE